MTTKSWFYYPVAIFEGTFMGSTLAPFVSVLPQLQQVDDVAVVLMQDSGPGYPQGLYMFDGTKYRLAMPMEAISASIIAGDVLSLYHSQDIDVVLPPEVTVYKNGVHQPMDVIEHGQTAVYAVRTPPASGGTGVVSVNGLTGVVITNASNLPGLATVGLTGSYTDLINLPAPYNLPIAGPGTLGGVKVLGPNLVVDGTGVVDVSPALLTTIGDKLNTLTSVGGGSSLISSASGSNVNLKSITGSGTVSVSSTGTTVNITGAAYILPPAAAMQLGGVKIGSGVNVAVDGTISVPPGLQIDDFNTSLLATWSSQKINDSLNAITKTSLGLGNVDNISAADMPVSTAQADADQAVLLSAMSYADTLTIGLWNDRGNYDASSNLWPSTGGSGSGGAILKGDIWTISVGGTLGGQPVVNRQTVRAMVNAPGQISNNWAISTATPEVEDQIVDGVTNKAPSQNAVFDALAALPHINDSTTSSTSLWSSAETSTEMDDRIADAVASLPVGIATADEGVPLSPTTTSINWTGGGVSGTAIGNAVTINVPGINAFVQAALNAKASDSTSLFSGGVLSINAGNNATIDISAGSAQFMDYTNPTNPTSQIVSFGPFTAVVMANILTQIVTYVGLQSNGTLVQQPTPFTPTQRRTIVQLGLAAHTNHVIVNAVNQITTPNRAFLNQMQDFIDAVGPLNLSGNLISTNGANLLLNKSAGMIFKYGCNFNVDPSNPHIINLASATGFTFRYRQANGTEGADRTTVVPNLYDNAGVLTSVTGGNFTIQHVYIFQSGLIRIQYGQETYGSLAAALDAISYENFIVDSNIASNAVALGLLVVRGNATDLTNTAQARLIMVSKFGATTANGTSSLTASDIAIILGYTPADAATAATLAGVQTLSNKTLTVPVINGYTEGGNSASGTAYSPSLAVADHELATTGNAVVTLPAPAQGKAFTLMVAYGGAHTLGFAGGTVRWVNGVVPVPTSVAGKYDYYEFKANRAGTFWIGRDGGRNI